MVGGVLGSEVLTVRRMSSTRSPPFVVRLRLPTGWAAGQLVPASDSVTGGSRMVSHRRWCRQADLKRPVPPQTGPELSSVALIRTQSPGLIGGTSPCWDKGPSGIWLIMFISLSFNIFSCNHLRSTQRTISSGEIERSPIQDSKRVYLICLFHSSDVQFDPTLLALTFLFRSCTLSICFWLFYLFFLIILHSEGDRNSDFNCIPRFSRCFAGTISTHFENASVNTIDNICIFHLYSVL